MVLPSRRESEHLPKCVATAAMHLPFYIDRPHSSINHFAVSSLGAPRARPRVIWHLGAAFCAAQHLGFIGYHGHLARPADLWLPRWKAVLRPPTSLAIGTQSPRANRNSSCLSCGSPSTLWAHVLQARFYSSPPTPPPSTWNRVSWQSRETHRSKVSPFLARGRTS